MGSFYRCGITYHPDLISVDASQEWLILRASCSFPAGGLTRRFGSANFDVAITGQNGAGPNDAVTGFLGVFGIFAFGGAIASRQGNVMKIDSAEDSSPPGQGPNWLGTGQSPPGTIDTFRYDNPMPNIISIAFHLDGTPGDRTIRTYHWQPPGFPPDYHILVYDDEE